MKVKSGFSRLTVLFKALEAVMRQLVDARRISDLYDANRKSKKWRYLSLIVLLLLGVMAVFFCLTPYRFVPIFCLVAIISTIFIFSPPPLSSWSVLLLKQCASHPARVLLVLLLVGVLLRLAYWAAFPETARLVSDFQHLWTMSENIANGKLSLSKSWTTVLFWGWVIMIFGKNTSLCLLTTWVLDLATVVLLIRFLSKFIALKYTFLFALLYVCSESIVAHGMSYTATEHLYALFLSAALLCFANVCKARGVDGLLVNAQIAGMFMWLSVWSRGEGILLWFVVPIWASICFYLLKKPVFILVTVLSFSISFAVGAVIGIGVNQKVNNATTIFCSKDNCWPQLFGSNIKSYGKVNDEDRNMIARLYENDHPNFRFKVCNTNEPNHQHRQAYPIAFHYECPQVVIPYIKDVIKRRWTGMGLGVAVRHIWMKEQNSWNWDFNFMLDSLNTQFAGGRRGLLYYAAQLYAFLVPALIALSGIIFSLVFGCLWFLNKVEISDFPALVYIPIIAGNMALLAYAESAPRYGYLFHVLWPICASLSVAWFARIRTIVR